METQQLGLKLKAEYPFPKAAYIESMQHDAAKNPDITIRAEISPLSSATAISAALFAALVKVSPATHWDVGATVKACCFPAVAGIKTIKTLWRQKRCQRQPSIESSRL